MQTYDSEYYKISERARSIGESLLQDCPQNDCVIYRNLYDKYTDLVVDYCQGAALLSDATLSLIYREINRLGHEIEQMWITNYAVRSLVRERYLDQSAVEPASISIPTADDIKAAIERAVRSLPTADDIKATIERVLRSLPTADEIKSAIERVVGSEPK